MASPKEITPLLPETLPEDFSEWDSEGSPTAKPDSPLEWKAREAAHSFSEASKAPGQSVDRRATLTSLADKPRVMGSASPVLDFAKPQKDFSDRDGAASPTAKPANPREWWTSPEWWESWQASHSIAETPEPVGQSAECETLENIEVEREPWTPKRKLVTVAAISVSTLLAVILLMIPLFHHGIKPVARQSVQPLTETSNTQPEPNTPKPSAGELLTQAKPPATTAAQQAANNQPANEGTTVNSAQVPTTVQTQMMNEQLTAPTRISQDSEKQVAGHAPPPLSLSMAGAGGLGGSSTNVSVFNGHAQPVVEAAPSKPVVISSGVVAGMLIRKSIPVYPPIAKLANVSGTVELSVTISKNGTIKDLQVLNGPAMLRQAAVDAVRTWRYKPYKVDNKPTEVQSTINVIFALGG